MLFTQCQEFYDDKLEEEGRRLNRLNKAATLTENTIISECLSSLISEIKRNLASLAECTEALKALRTSFFTELKRIGDLVHIKLPEPSDIDLIRDKAADPKEIVGEYCGKHGLRMNPDYPLVLAEALEGVQPVLFDRGGSKYTEELFDILQETLPASDREYPFYRGMR